MATNWGIETNSKASTTDDFSIQRNTRILSARDDAWITWDTGSRTSPIGKDTTWTIDGGAVTKDSD